MSDKETTILLADDEAQNLQTLYDHLRNAPRQYNMLTAGGGRAALEIARAERPDVILTDWLMPDLSGIDLLKALREHRETAAIPVIIATGQMTRPEDLFEALNEGAVDFLRKPVDKLELYARVEAALRMADAYQHLARLYKELHYRHSGITDSFVYAGRLQRLLLPELYVLKRKVADAFILLQPRDIVSGDFYWFNVKRNAITLMAADATGHGVPGAFMSVIGVNALNQIVRDFPDLSPERMMLELNDRVTSLLSRHAEDVTENAVAMDGMDAALVHIDLKTQTFAFSGAGRPMIHVRNGAVEVIRGDATPIGGASAMYGRDAYTVHTLGYQPGDCLYLFSDGYPDQFGEGDKRKFGAARFRELIAQVWHEPMDVQQKIFEQVFAEWRGDNHQTDDVLIIGVRL